VVRAAAAAAIAADDYEKALEWPEQGRSIIWGQVLSLCTPVDDLKRGYPALADELIRLSTLLETVSLRSSIKAPDAGPAQSPCNHMHWLIKGTGWHAQQGVQLKSTHLRDPRRCSRASRPPRLKAPAAVTARKAPSPTRLSYHTLNRNRLAAHFPSHLKKGPASSVQILVQMPATICAIPSNSAAPLLPHAP
jgi:hypothetical protein